MEQTSVMTFRCVWNFSEHVVCLEFEHEFVRFVALLFVQKVIFCRMYEIKLDIIPVDLSEDVNYKCTR